MKVYFLRHGEAEHNAAGLLGGHYDTALTDTGEEQAHSAIEHVRAIQPETIYCSPLLRAHKTAEIVAAGLGLQDKLVVDDRLKERAIGVFEGKSGDDGTARVSKIADETEGAETIAELRARADSFLQDLALRHRDETVLIVGHGAHIKMMISILTGTPWEEVREVVLPHGRPFQAIEEVS